MPRLFVTASSAWLAWLDGFRQRSRCPSRAHLVDQALEAYARAKDYAAPPPRIERSRSEEEK